MSMKKSKSGVMTFAVNRLQPLLRTLDPPVGLNYHHQNIKWEYLLKESCSAISVEFQTLVRSMPMHTGVVLAAHVDPTPQICYHKYHEDYLLKYMWIYNVV